MNSTVARRNPRTRVVAWLPIALGPAGVAEAQGRPDCRSPLPPSVGVAFGRSSPYVELASGVVEPPGTGSVQVRAGAQFGARAELPVVGPLRVRIDAATARWDVRQTTYDPNGFTVTADTSVGHMSARHRSRSSASGPGARRRAPTWPPGAACMRSASAMRPFGAPERP